MSKHFKRPSRARKRAGILGAAALVAGAIAAGTAALDANESTAGASAAGPSYSCTTSTANGSCGPYAYKPHISSASGGGTYVNNNVWSPPAGFTGQSCLSG